MGFPNRWRKRITFCISTVRFSILINSEAFRFFSSSRDLKQCDLGSPLLFILVMETLNRLVINAGEEAFLNGFHINNPHSEGLLISHLLFADDTLVFYKPDESNFGLPRVHPPTF